MSEHPDPIALFSVTDLLTGETGGSVTHRFNAELKGKYIKITGDDASCRISLRDVDTEEKTKLKPQYIVTTHRAY